MTALGGAHRVALVEATVAEFAAVGYERASLNRIIRAAGLSKSSFYHAVGSKTELFDEVVRVLIEDVRAEWTAPSPADFATPDFWTRVDAVLAAFAKLAQGTALPLLGRIFYLPAVGSSDARTDLLASVGAWVAEVIRVGRAAGAIRADMPVDLQAAAAFGMLRGVDEWVLGAGPLSSVMPARPLDGGGAEDRGEAAAPGILLRRLLGT